jgi:protoporphyrin/coproporphyrin ferrochelatase
VSVSSPFTSAEHPTALLLFNLGGPDTLADVEPFLINLFSDREIIELPGGMSPHSSRATTGSSESERQRVLATPRWRGHFQVSGIASYPDDPFYLDALTDTVRKGLAGFPPDVRDRVVLLFSAHGLPKKFVDRGDPYVEHTKATRDGIVARLNVPNRHVLGFQSRTGPVEWIGPGTEQVIEELGREGVREVLVVPLSFVSDHIETLYEVDMLFRDDATKAGIADYRRTEALNTHPLFIEALAGLVERHVMETVCST